MLLFKKILFSDYDWTMNPHDNPQDYEKNLKAVQDWRAAGNLFALATGRGIESLRSIFPDYEQYCDFCVLCDGAYIVDNKGKVLYSDHFGQNLAQTLYDALEDYDYIGNHAIISFTHGLEKPYITAGTSKIRLWFAEKADCLGIEKMLKTQFASTISFTSYYDAAFNDDDRLDWVEPNMHCIIEVERAGINKRSGIKKIADSLCLKDFSRIVTIGDGANDVEMIRDYDGYCVASANPEVIKNTPDGHIVHHLNNLIAEELSQN